MNTPKFKDINTQEAHSKTLGSLDNNGYLNPDSMFGAVFALVEIAKNRGCTLAQLEAHENKALHEVYKKPLKWGLWNSDRVQRCWVSDDDGHFGTGAPKRFATEEAAVEYRGGREHLLAREIPDQPTHSCRWCTVPYDGPLLDERCKHCREARRYALQGP